MRLDKTVVVDDAAWMVELGVLQLDARLAYLALGDGGERGLF